MTAFWENILSLGPAIGIAVWGLLSKYWNPPTAIVYGVLLLCACIYLAERFVSLPLRMRIRNWLDEAGQAVTTQTVPGFNFMFEALDKKTGLYVSVGQLASEPHQIEVAMPKVKPNDEQMMVFSQWTPEQQARFWTALRMELFRARIGFTRLTFEENGFLLNISLPVDRDLTKTSLMHAMLSVMATGRLCLEMFGQMRPPMPSIVHTASPPSSPTS